MNSYFFRRIFHGLWMYVALVLTFSVVFYQVSDKSLRAQADEEVTKILHSAGVLDPVDYQRLRTEVTKAKVQQYHLEDPWTLRILWQSWNVLTFHFGKADSLKTSAGDREVLALILDALPNTLILFTTETVIVLFLGSLVGLMALRKPGGPLDKTLSLLPMVLNGLPAWWIGMFGLMAFSYVLPLFPSGGIHSIPEPVGIWGIIDYIWHMSLPLILLVILNLGSVAWQVRSLLAGTFSSQPITVARAKGLSETRILFVHVLAVIRPALLTLVILGLLQSLSGNLLMEGIFQWPGLGSLYFIAVQQSDVPVLLGILSLQTLLNLLGLVFLDLAYGWMDPRIRHGGQL